MKSIYLTFDIEPLVNNKSFNPTIYNSMLVGGLFIAKELEKRNLKATFYVSLSKKTKALDTSSYYEGLDMLLRALKDFKNISVQPHLHAYNLPMSFPTENDLFGSYTVKQQESMLRWAINYLKDYGFEVNSFRPGSYSTNNGYYEALKSVGIKNSSVLNATSDQINIDLINNKVYESQIKTINDIKEYPVTSVYLQSIKRKNEIINLSPDFLTIESMQPFIDKLEYININFHSFSVFTSKFLRENHNKVWFQNFKYFFWRKPITNFMKKMNIELIEHDLTLQNELIKWLDYIEQKNYSTFFVGEN